MRFAHTNIISTDWRRLSDFYCQVFGCQLVPPERQQSGSWLDQGTGLKHASLRGVHLRLPGHGVHGPTLEIYQYQDTINSPTPQPNHTGFGHLAFEVEDVAAVMAQVMQHGGQSQGQLTQKDVPGVGLLTFCYVRDPDGNLLELQNWQPVHN